MAVTFKDRSGRTIPSRSAQAEADKFCERLAEMEAKDLGLKTDVQVSYHLGLGSVFARGQVYNHGLWTKEWPGLTHWFTRPDLGDTLLPEDATWMIQRLDGESEAILTIDGVHVTARARCPWAAFAICLIRAFGEGLFDPTVRTKRVAA